MNEIRVFTLVTTLLVSLGLQAQSTTTTDSKESVAQPRPSTEQQTTPEQSLTQPEEKLPPDTQQMTTPEATGNETAPATEDDETTCLTMGCG